MSKSNHVIALLTDFGLRDPYVGIMKGVILGIHPEARIVDLTHEVRPQDVREAAFLLSGSIRYFPDGTVFVAVVDPGVGTDRPILAVRTDRHVFLAPDNGLLGFLYQAAKIRRVVEVRQREYFLEPVSRTFQGRDIFAPVAARISMGLDIRKLGPTVKTPKGLPPEPVAHNGTIEGEVVTIDRFGNLVTNIPGEGLSAKAQVKLGSRTIKGLSETYESARPGHLLALVSSSGTVELAVNRGNAQEVTGAAVGSRVRIKNR